MSNITLLHDLNRSIGDISGRRNPEPPSGTIEMPEGLGNNSLELIIAHTLCQAYGTQLSLPVTKFSEVTPTFCVTQNEAITSFALGQLDAEAYRYWFIAQGINDPAIPGLRRGYLVMQMQLRRGDNGRGIAYQPALEMNIQSEPTREVLEKALQLLNSSK